MYLWVLPFLEPPFAHPLPQARQQATWGISLRTPIRIYVLLDCITQLHSLRSILIQLLDCITIYLEVICGSSLISHQWPEFMSSVQETDMHNQVLVSSSAWHYYLHKNDQSYPPYMIMPYKYVPFFSHMILVLFHAIIIMPYAASLIVHVKVLPEAPHIPPCHHNIIVFKFMFMIA